jgi:alanine dehydrogenase
MAPTNASLRYALEIADRGWQLTCLENREIKLGVNYASGNIP